MNTDQAKWGNSTSPNAQFPQVFAVVVSVQIHPQIRAIRGMQLKSLFRNILQTNQLLSMAQLS